MLSDSASSRGNRRQVYECCGAEKLDTSLPGYHSQRTADVQTMGVIVDCVVA